MSARTDEARAVRILRAAGTCMLVLVVVMLRTFPSAAVRANLPGFSSPVIGFELAATPEDVAGILGAPGTAEHAEAARRMDRGNRIDFAFMVAYAAFHVGIALLLAAQGAPRAVVTVLLVFAALMAPFDALENRQLLVLSHATPSPEMTAALARLRAFTLVKWTAIFAFAGLAAPYVWSARGWWRWSAPVFALGALLGLIAIAYLPALEYGANVVAVAWLMTWVRAFL